MKHIGLIQTSFAQYAMSETSGTLRSAGGDYGGGSETLILTYDARGNGDGETVCTITGGHCANISDFTPVVMDDMGG